MTTKPSPRQTQLARTCIQNAKSVLGCGWAHVSNDVRWGLVAANVLSIFDQNEDEDISAERIVAHTRGILAAARTLFEEEHGQN